MSTRAEMEANKAAQRQEAQDLDNVSRNTMLADGVNPDVRDEPGRDDFNDRSNPDPPDVDARRGEDEGHEPGKPQIIRRSPLDDQRNEIANRFKNRRRGVKDIEGEEDLRSDETVYGDHQARQDQQQQQDPADPSQEDDQAAPTNQQPRKFRLKVRGEERDVPEDELIALAQKGAAGDDYLAEAKELLNRARAESGGPGRQHQAEDTRSSDPELPSDPSEDAHHQGDEMEELVEAIQFGTDKKEIAKKLAAVIAKRSSQAVTTTQVERDMQREADRASAYLSEFFSKDENADLKDDVAQAAMQRLAFREFREDLKKVGIAEDQLPKTPNEIAQWHRYHRAMGDRRVRTVEQITDKVVSEVRSRFAGAPKPDQQRQQQRQTQPRVAVNREQRRQQIPVQPARSSAPPQAPQRPANISTSRKSAIAKIQQSRGQGYT